MSIYFLNQFYMIYEFMRLVLFFDLPMKTKKEVKIYTHFRKYLIKNGYMMMQFLFIVRFFQIEKLLLNM